MTDTPRMKESAASRFSILWWLGPLIVNCTLLAGCGSGPTFIYPVTEGSYRELPPPNSRLVVWGTEPSVAGTATMWLQRRGLAMVDRARLQQVLEDRRNEFALTSLDQGEIVRIVKGLGVHTLVFTKGEYTTEEWSLVGQMTLGGADGVVTLLRSTAVHVRGVDIDTGEVVWSGSARYRYPRLVSMERVGEALTKLTCQALATAWGVRPAGGQAISSQAMCAVEGRGSERGLKSLQRVTMTDR